jgi:hypothetical protein
MGLPPSRFYATLSKAPGASAGVAQRPAFRYAERDPGLLRFAPGSVRFPLAEPISNGGMHLRGRGPRLCVGKEPPSGASRPSRDFTLPSGQVQELPFNGRQRSATLYPHSNINKSWELHERGSRWRTSTGKCQATRAEGWLNVAGAKATGRTLGRSPGLLLFLWFVFFLPFLSFQAPRWVHSHG